MQNETTNKYITNSELKKFLDLVKEFFPDHFNKWDEQEDYGCNGKDCFYTLKLIPDKLHIDITLEAPSLFKEVGFFIYSNGQQIQDKHFITLTISDVRNPYPQSIDIDFVDAEKAITYVINKYKELNK